MKSTKKTKLYAFEKSGQNVFHRFAWLDNSNPECDQSVTLKSFGLPSASPEMLRLGLTIILTLDVTEIGLIIHGAESSVTNPEQVKFTSSSKLTGQSN